MVARVVRRRMLVGHRCPGRRPVAGVTRKRRLPVIAGLAGRLRAVVALRAGARRDVGVVELRRRPGNRRVARVAARGRRDVIRPCRTPACRCGSSRRFRARPRCDRSAPASTPSRCGSCRSRAWSGCGRRLARRLGAVVAARAGAEHLGMVDAHAGSRPSCCGRHRRYWSCGCAAHSCRWPACRCGTGRRCPARHWRGRTAPASRRWSSGRCRSSRVVTMWFGSLPVACVPLWQVAQLPGATPA